MKKDKKKHIAGILAGSLLLSGSPLLATECSATSDETFGSANTVRQSLVEVNTTTTETDTDTLIAGWPFGGDEADDAAPVSGDKAIEGKCGEGKCGEGKCGEGKCGGDHLIEDGKKMMEGKCGEAKCGEGTCGG